MPSIDLNIEDMNWSRIENKFKLFLENILTRYNLKLTDHDHKFFSLIKSFHQLSEVLIHNVSFFKQF